MLKEIDFFDSWELDSDSYWSPQQSREPVKEPEPRAGKTRPYLRIACVRSVEWDTRLPRDRIAAYKRDIRGLADAIKGLAGGYPFNPEHCIRSPEDGARFISRQLFDGLGLSCDPPTREEMRRKPDSITSLSDAALAAGKTIWEYALCYSHTDLLIIHPWGGRCTDLLKEAVEQTICLADSIIAMEEISVDRPVSIAPPLTVHWFEFVWSPDRQAPALHLAQRLSVS